MASSTRSCAYKAVVFSQEAAVDPSCFGFIKNYELKQQLPTDSVMTAIAETQGIALGTLETSPLTLDAVAKVTAARLAKHANNNIEPADIVSVMRSIKAELYPEVSEALQCIRAEEVKTVLVNNGVLQQDEGFRKKRDNYFDLVIERIPYSSICDVIKDRLDVTAGEIVYLDEDGIGLDAATKAGFCTITIKDIKSAIKDLENVLGFPLEGFVPGTETCKASNISIDRLEKYLQEELDLHQEGPPILRAFPQGFAHPTYYVAYGGCEMVIKGMAEIRFRGKGINPVHHQYRILKALEQTDVPTPKVYALCEDTGIIGSEFFIMEYVRGRYFKKPSLPEVEPHERKAIFLAMTEALRKIHSVDVDAIGLGDLPGRENVYQHIFDTINELYRTEGCGGVGEIDQLYEWLSFPENLPPTGVNTTLIHRDFRMGNLIFHESRAEVIAVLDWEGAILGDPFLDLGYLCVVTYAIKSIRDLPPLNELNLQALGIPAPAELVQDYLSCSRRTLDHKWEFYLGMAYWFLGAALYGITQKVARVQHESDTGILQRLGSDTVLGWTKIVAGQGLKIVHKSVDYNK